MTERQPVADLRPLAPMIGRWASEGETIATDDEPSIVIVGTDVYTWLADGHFIEHRVHVRMGDDIVEVLEIIGGRDGTAWTMRAFDNEGTFTEMRATADPTGTLTFADDATRATLTIADDRQSMHARWERSNGSDWSHWVNMRFTRI